MRGRCIAVFFCVLLGCCPAAGAAEFQPGFKTLGIWLEGRNMRLDINVWYPSRRKPSKVRYGSCEFEVARNGLEAAGRFPLVLLSHDSPGTRFSHHETAAYLARAGFVAAAITHGEDNADNMPRLFTLRQLSGRVEQLRAALDVLVAHEEISRCIDPERVGVAGFGAGGTAALLLGGALPSARGWENYCPKAGPADSYCTDWARPRMQRLAEALPLTASLADTRVKAVAVAAPAYGMLFDKEGLQWLYPPLLLIRAGIDGVNRPSLHADAILRGLSAPPFFADLKDVKAEAFMSACPPASHKETLVPVGGMPPEERSRALKRLNSLLGQFFLKTLGKADNPLHIPPPPDLTPPPPPAPEAKADSAPEKKKGRSAARVKSAQ